MPWSEILPNKPPSQSAVMLSVGLTGGRFEPRLRITIRHSLLPGLDWFRTGAGVHVHEGVKEHAGVLRITPGGPWVLGEARGRHASDTIACLSIPAPPGLDRIKPVAAEHDWHDDWIEVTLPRPPAPAPAPVAAPPPPEPPKRGPGRPPHAGIMERTEDPAVILQRKQGGRVR